MKVMTTLYAYSQSGASPKGLPIQYWPGSNESSRPSRKANSGLLSITPDEFFFDEQTEFCWNGLESASQIEIPDSGPEIQELLASGLVHGRTNHLRHK